MKWLVACFVGSALCASSVNAQGASEREWRGELLDIGFEAVEKMPLNPHIKNRSREQHLVVRAWLTLDEPQRAERLLKDIANWRRWQGYADIALWHAKRGEVKRAERAIEHPESMLAMAADLRSGEVIAASSNPLIDSLSDWRYQSVQATVMEARVAMGEAFAAATVTNQLNADLSAAVLSESADAEALRAMATDTHFEVARYAMSELIERLDERYATDEASKLLEEHILPNFKKTPVFMRLNVLLELADVMTRNGDSAAAIEILNRCDDLIDLAGLPPRLLIPERTRVIKARALAGDAKGANEALEASRRVYDEKRALVVDVERAGVLVALAEGCVAVDDLKTAGEFYELAAREAWANPNGRPRASDLNRVCRSMALSGARPSEQMMKDLKMKKNELGSPW